MIKRRLLPLALGALFGPIAFGGTYSKVRFIIVDPRTGKPVPGWVVVEGSTKIAELPIAKGNGGPSDPIDVEKMVLLSKIGPEDRAITTISIRLDQTIEIQETQEHPVKEITIRVTATRLVLNRAPSQGVSTVRDHNEIAHFINSTSGDTKSLTKGQKGVAEDSAGQQHVRGEHADLMYVVDGVPLPDTLSGRQGSIVVPSTIDSLELLTGAFAPEFGGETAGVLNNATVASAKQASTQWTMQGGSYQTFNSELSATGPLGKKANYVFDFGETSTKNAIEPQQPDNQTAHNAGSSQNYFGKIRYDINDQKSLTFTASNNPDRMQIGNRTGLPAAFAQAGQGYGFLGLRNADGSETGVTAANAGLLGSQTIKLASQEAAGQDINQKEVSEFATLQFQQKSHSGDQSQFAVTALHSGQTVNNSNPFVDATTLMTQHIDNSIEYNPNATRNVHHLQAEGSYSATRGSHKLKAGFLWDAQNGNESYNIQAASQLALDELYNLAPSLCPTGKLTGAKDVNGNPVFVATSNAYPTLLVQRTGSYKAAYVQDTWQLSKRFTVNYGVRADWFSQSENLGQSTVDAFMLSPRINFSYKLTARDDLRWAYNRLFNTPPLAQGAIVGQAIQPETLSQYDISIEHRLGHGQTLGLAYYYKDIKNQVDTGLLIPGSEIGLYTAVNFGKGAVHGVEASYNISPPGGIGWDSFVNLTYSSAMPNGLDNTGAPVPDYNDHDQRFTAGLGVAYAWKGGASVATTLDFGTGLASSIVPPNSDRTSRTQIDMHMTTGDHMFKGKGGLNLDVTNLFDNRKVINFQSGFSGTRFQMGRSILLSAFFKF